LVDIFAMVPQSVPPTSGGGFPAQDARLLRYQHVLKKISNEGLSDKLTGSPPDDNTNVSDGWISEEDDAGANEGRPPAKSADVGPLLGGFADAENVE
jgi:hypothetical protein